MRTALYSICYNEEVLLPFFLRHYAKFVDKIVIYDNYSTDSSRDLALTADCEVRMHNTNNQIRDDLLLQVKNEAWKECRGQGFDWIIVVDIDEIIYNPKLVQFLSSAIEEQYTLLIPTGYQMVSSTLPDIKLNKQIYETHKSGYLAKRYSKPCIFNPDKLEDINFMHGCHVAYPAGQIKPLFNTNLQLLHYSYLSPKWYISRMRERRKRMSKINKENKWGSQYLRNDSQHATNFKAYLKRAYQVVPMPTTSHVGYYE